MEYSILSHISISKPPSLTISVSNCALGDAVSSVYMLENIGRQSKCEFYLEQGEMANNILKSFDFNNIKITDKIGIKLKNLQIKHSQYFLLNFKKWLRKEFTFNFDDFISIKPKSNVCCKNGKIAIQFDSKSHQRRKVKMYDPEPIIKLFTKQVEIVGGPGTTAYLPYPVRSSPLPELVSTLLEYDLFLGVDSGISHLAGVMGMPSMVVIAENYKTVSSIYKTYYNCVTLSPSLVPY